MTFPAPASDRPEPRTILRPGPVVTQSAWPAERRVRSIHVVRIGGAGMSAVARLALESGLVVSGSDSQDGQFIGPLREAGARIGIGFDAGLLAEDVDLVVVSTAVRPDNPEVIAARERGVPVIHRAAALAGLMGERDVVAIAGTHGKTTTTGMAVMALRGAGEDPAWALGAAVPDLGRNAGLGGDCAVIEADESDGSFLAFAPTALVVTNLEPDHLDFHGDAATLTAAFDALSGRVRPGGALIVCADDDGAAALGERARAAGVRVESYGVAGDADWRVLSERAEGGTAVVELVGPRGPLLLRLGVVGHHNALNAVGALAAVAAARPQLGVEALAEGLGAFTGASRRFDIAGSAAGVTVVDDYAHHPREVGATLLAARGIQRDAGGTGRVLAVFQPHLFSRTRAFAPEFAAALALADEAWVMPVYAAREDPDPAVSAATIADLAPEGARLRVLAAREDAPAAVAAEAREGDLVLMLGAGDIVEVTPAVLAALAAERA